MFEKTASVMSGRRFVELALIHKPGAELVLFLIEFGIEAPKPATRSTLAASSMYSAGSDPPTLSSTVFASVRLPWKKDPHGFGEFPT